MSIDAPERVYISGSEYRNLREKRINQPHLTDPVEYVRADKLEELAAENEHNDYMKDKWRERASSAEAALAEKNKEIVALRGLVELYMEGSAGGIDG